MHYLLANIGWTLLVLFVLTMVTDSFIMAIMILKSFGPIIVFCPPPATQNAAP